MMFGLLDLQIHFSYNVNDKTDETNFAGAFVNLQCYNSMVAKQ